jgi:hypothetical protein
MLMLVPSCLSCRCEWDQAIESRSNRDNVDVAVGVMGMGECVLCHTMLCCAVVMPTEAVIGVLQMFVC